MSPGAFLATMRTDERQSLLMPDSHDRGGAAENAPPETIRRDKEAPPRILMTDLLSAVYWFDDALQTGLAAKGWPGVSRFHSVVLGNIATGTQRAAAIARLLVLSHRLSG